MKVLPADTLAEFTAGLTGVLAANIGVVIGILALVFGIKFIFRLFNKSTRGHL